MKILYLDCFAGISGDMMIGALLDLGLDLDVLRQELRRLPLDGYRLEVAKVTKQSLQATKFNVILTSGGSEQLADAEFQEHDPTDHPPHPGHAHTHHPDDEHNHISNLQSLISYSPAHETHPSDPSHRSLAEILGLIQASSLTDSVKMKASRVFTRLGEAEAKVHGVPLAEIHFHEVGGVDAIVDIVGTAIGLEQLGIERIYASPLPLGSGFIRAAHGVLPVPAPATANLIIGVPVYSSQIKGELVTPTGAALVTTLADGFGPMPLMVTQATGYGAGSREREFPNVLRAFLGEEIAAAEIKATSPRPVRAPFPQQHQAAPEPAGYHQSQTTVIEANIDDMNPQFFEGLIERLLEAGALDVVLIPVQMKKSRPGAILQVLAHPTSVDDLSAIIFTEATTIGVRTYEVTKRMLQREIQTVETPFGPVRVKVARLGSHVVNIAPEYEDCRELARQHQVPVKEIYNWVNASLVLFERD